jgi:hypothetical protein
VLARRCRRREVAVARFLGFGLVTVAVAIASASCSVSLSQSGPGGSKHAGNADRTTTTTTRPVRVAALYISTGVEPASVYGWPHFPVQIDVDNHASFVSLEWQVSGTGDVTGSGDYSYDSCTPDCATGAEVSDPVTITASDPMRCSVNVYNPENGATLALVARVFSVEQIAFPVHTPPTKPALGPVCT